MHSVTSDDVMASYCDVTTHHIRGTTCYIKMSDDSCGLQTPQKVFRQEPEEAGAEAAAENM